MSVKKVKTYTYHCDFCHREVEGRTRPDGWEELRFTHHDCGLTGYSTTERMDACPECAPEQRENADPPNARVY